MSDEQTGQGSNVEKAIGRTEVVIAGEKHYLEYTLWSFCKLDELTGKNPLSGTTWTEVHPKDVLALLWAGLLHEEKFLTLEELGKKVTLAEVATIGPLIQKAMEQAMPVPDEEKKTQSLANEVS